MKKIISLIIIISALVLSGCTEITSGRNVMSGRTVTVEDAFNGVYAGDGMRLDMYGNTSYSFKSELKAYAENGAIYMRETIANQGDRHISHTFRITKTEAGGYTCTDVDTLKPCTLSAQGDSIVLKADIDDSFGSDERHFTATNVYQFFGNGKMIKRTLFNRYIFFFDQEEIISYQKQ